MPLPAVRERVTGGVTGTDAAAGIRKDRRLHY
jgi:hypothetical protein